MTMLERVVDQWLIPGTEKGDMDRSFSVLFPIDMKRGQVGLIKKNRPAWQKGKLNGAGGHQKIGESPFGCANREGAQELGLTLPDNGQPDQGQWQLFHYERHRTGNKLYFYTADVPNLDERVRTLTDEDVHLISLDDFHAFMAYDRLPFAPKDNADRYDRIGGPESRFVYNLSYLIPMAYSWLKWPEHRYLEG